MWKEVVVAYIIVVSWNFAGGTDESH